MYLDDIPDSVLAALIRQSPYLQGVRFDSTQRYIAVFAISSDATEGIVTPFDLMENLKDFVSDYDWEERNFTVLDVPAGTVTVRTPESEES